jgi:hypothetical protein
VGYNVPYKQDIDIFCFDQAAWLNICSQLNKIVSTSTPSIYRVVDGIFFNVVNCSSLGSPEKVLASFDLLPCAVMVTRRNGFAVDKAISAIKEKLLLVHTVKSFFSLMLRIQKYIKRGFTLRCITVTAIEYAVFEKASLQLEGSFAKKSFSYYDEHDPTHLGYHEITVCHRMIRECCFEKEEIDQLITHRRKRTPFVNQHVFLDI